LKGENDMKTLYFEGAGCVPANDVENCRIRTAFTNKAGEKIYLEMSSGCKHTRVRYGVAGKLESPKKIITTEDGYICCDFCHYITSDPKIDDVNYSRLSCERNAELKMKYTKANILAFVNEHCNADFDEIVVLDNLAGYRVFADYTKNTVNTPLMYNYGDTFEYDAELTKKRRAKVEQMKREFEQLFNQRYDNTSYYIKNGDLVVRLNVSDDALEAANWTKGRRFIVEV
jgi:hypothetical protein